MLCGMLEMKTAARKLALIGNAVPTWIPKISDSGTPSTTEPTTMPIAPPTPASPKRFSTTMSATKKTATPISIHRPSCQFPSCSCASGTRSVVIAAISAPAPKPAMMPTRREGTFTQHARSPASRRDDAPSSPSPRASSTAFVLRDGLDVQLEPAHGEDPNRAARRHGLGGARLPELPEHSHVAGRRERLGRLPDSADQVLDARSDLLASHPALEEED